MADHSTKEIIEELVLKEKKRQERISAIRKPHDSDCWQSFDRTYIHPSLFLLNDGTHAIMVPDLRFANKRAYFIQPSGDYISEGIEFVSRSTKFGEKVSNIIALDSKDFLDLLAAEHDDYKKSLADKSDIEKVLVSRNNYYFNNVFSRLKLNEGKISDIAKIIAEINMPLENARTKYFILENATFIDSFTIDDEVYTNRVKQPLVGLVTTRDINKKHVYALFGEIANQTDAVFQELQLDWRTNTSRIYPVALNDLQTIKALKTAKPRYEINLVMILMNKD
jgi:hypothetical protein